jgi:hypothetical protein
MTTAYATFEPGIARPVPGATFPEYGEDGSNANIPFLGFDAGDNANETALFGPIRLSSYASTPIANVRYEMASATTGSVIWGVSVLAYTPGDAGALTGESFDSENMVTDAVPSSTAGKMKDSGDISLTNFDGGADGDFVLLKVRRVTSAGNGDTASGDAKLRQLILRYTTT